MRQSSIDLFAAFAVIFVGLFFLVLAGRIETSGYQTAAEALVGPAMVPTLIAAMIIGLGILNLVSIIRSRHVGLPLPGKATSEAERSEFADLTIPVIVRIVIALAIGFAYVWLLSATGYIISTALALAALLVLFGTRSPVTIVLITIGGTAVYYFVFIWLMGIYSPAGWLVSFG